MSKFVTIMALAVALAFVAAPLASAEWKAYGTYEPDSRLDNTDFLHTLKPAEYKALGQHKAKIYFNAYVQADTVAFGGSFNPNNGVTYSQQNYAPSSTWLALLGVWNDCNGDGYVGLAETAVREYRSEVLTAAQLAACPAESKAEIKVAGRPVGTLIIEFITIGREGLGVQDPRSIVDPAALVWGDEGKPAPDADDIEFTTPGQAPRACGVGGLGGPKGTYDTVGGVLDNAECITGRQGIAVWNAVVPGILGDQYEFTGDTYDQPGHPVGDRDTFGRDDKRGNSYVFVSDCSKAPIVDLGTVLGSDRNGHGPRPPRTQPTVNPNGNVAGTYNETYESSVQNCKTQAEGDAQADFDREFYDQLEGSSGANGAQSALGKVAADFNFVYKEMSRSAIPCGPVFFSQDCGVSPFNGPLGSSTVGQNSFWSAGEPLFSGPLGTFSTRAAAEGRFANATYYTFYAAVGGPSLLKGDTPGGAGEYMSAFCGSGGYEQTGSTQYHYGVNCNKNQWNLGGDGTIQFTQAYPGLGYQFRDVDCFDGSMAKGTPAAISTQKFGDEPCWDDNLPQL